MHESDIFTASSLKLSVYGLMLQHTFILKQGKSLSVVNYVQLRSKFHVVSQVVHPTIATTQKGPFFLAVH